MKGRWGWEVHESVWLYSSTKPEIAACGDVVVDGVEGGGGDYTATL